MGFFTHGVFTGLHILAILFGVAGLFISIPLHIIVYLLLRKKSGGNQE
jgi:predicted PurR-regulated permease PerM